MKLSASDWKLIVRLSLVWTLLNVFFNIMGLFITKITGPDVYVYFQSLTKDFIRPLFYQSLCFFVVTLLVFSFLKHINGRKYIFPVLQFLIFNLIFFVGLKFRGGVHFESTFDSFGIKYLSNFGQFIVDIFYKVYPMPGNFEEGVFAPKSTGLFYFHWILLTSSYYFLLSWLTGFTHNFFFVKNINTENTTVN